MPLCIGCKKEVDWEEVKETFEVVFEQADSYGMASLTESQQFVVEGKVCSDECLEALD